MQQLLIALSLGCLLLAGCGRSPAQIMKLSQAKPEINLLRLGFDDSSCVVDEHVEDQLSLFSDAWVFTLKPITGEDLKNAESALREVVRNGGPTYRSDSIEDSTDDVIVYRYLRDVEDEHFAIQGDYLINIDDHWLIGGAFARAPGGLLDQTDIDRMLLSLQLFDQPRAKPAPLTAWQEYQKHRVVGSANAKFILAMAPAPIYVGRYSQYVEMVNARAFPQFTNNDYLSGGRVLEDQLLEFYGMDDPTSVRIDVWLNRKPPHGTQVEEVFYSAITVDDPTLDVWSSETPCSLPIKPGRYAVDVLLIHRGKYPTEKLTETERFERDDLERYEVYLNELKVRPFDFTPLQP